MKRHTWLLGYVVIPLCLIACWWIISSRHESLYFPSLQKIFAATIEDWKLPAIRKHLLPSVTRLCVGFAIGIAAGVTLGILMGYFDRLRNLLLPITEFMRALPSVALLPLAFLIIGPGAGMEIALIAISSTWPILVATCDGARGTDPVMLQSARAYGLNRSQMLRRVILPAAVPSILSGVQVAIQFAVALMLLSNFVGSDRGLGYFVLDAQSRFDVDSTWGGILVIAVVGFVAVLPLQLAQHVLLRWHRGWRQAANN